MKGCRPLNKDEVRRVLDELGNGRYGLRNQALFMLGVKAGFRISEMLSLRIMDVLEDGVIKDHIHVKRSHMKRKKAGRTVALNGRAATRLKKWLNQLMDQYGATRNDYVFRSQVKGEPITRNHAWEIIKTACRRAGVYGATGTHAMRKTFANDVHKALGGDLARTQIALGHTNIRSTINYLGFDQADIDRAVRGL
jgi:site-specific recombinase XerD